MVMVGAVILVLFTVERFTGMFFIGLGLILQNAATHGFRFAKLMPVPLPVDSVIVPPEIPAFPEMPEEIPEAAVPAENPVEENSIPEDTVAEDTGDGENIPGIYS
jgi:hypothetical protein